MMAARMKIRGVAGCIVGGRVRDITELKNSELPVSFCPFPRMCPMIVSLPFFHKDQSMTDMPDLRFGEVDGRDKC